jgi:NAD(P)-dependent dehydrogenase (short-subunit alcohol dehydrogenase family)
MADERAVLRSVNHLFDLTGRVAIVTGGSAGLGPQMAEALAEMGAHLVICAYHASKGGVVTLTKDLACKWAMQNINVNAIAPGWFPTNMSRVVIERNKDTLRRTIPLGRFGNEQDLKGPAISLASAASDFVTGHDPVVDGGQSAC